MEPPSERTVPGISAAGLWKGGLRAIATLAPRHIGLLTACAAATVTVAMLADMVIPQPLGSRFDMGVADALFETPGALGNFLALNGIRVGLVVLLYSVAVTSLVAARPGDATFSRGFLRCMGASLGAALCTCLAYACLVLPAFVASSALCLAGPLAARHALSPARALEESAARMSGNKAGYVFFRVVLLAGHGALQLALRHLFLTSVAPAMTGLGSALHHASWFALIAPPILVHILLVAGADAHLEDETNAARTMQRAHEVFA